MSQLYLKLQSNYKTQDYFLVFLVLLTTVNPFWNGNKFVQLFIFSLIFIRSHKKYNKIIFDTKIALVFCAITIITILQGILWGFSLFTLFSSFVLTYLYTFYLFQIYKTDLFILLERILWGYTIFSLIIFFTYVLLPSFGSLLSHLIKILEQYSSDVETHSRSLMFYTYRLDYGMTRNSGFAGEPGAFAVFITFGIIINFLRGLPLNHKRNMVYYLALGTTFSTAGFIALFILFLLLIKNRKYRIFSIIFLLVIIPISINFFIESPFMQDKIQEQFEGQSQKGLYGQTTGRFYGMRKSIYVLQLYPFHGRGLQAATMPGSYSPEYAAYGWIAYISKLGLIFGGIFLFYYLKGIYNLIISSGFDKFVFIIITISIFINLSSQPFLMHPFFLLFFFIGLYNYKITSSDNSNDITKAKIINNRRHRFVRPGGFRKLRKI